MTRSPSGDHLLCLGCQRIIILPRKERKEKEEDSESGAKVAPESSEAVD